MRVTVRWIDIVLGTTYHGSLCPVARAIRRATGRRVCVSVGTLTIGGHHRGAPPPVAQRFIVDFDRTAWVGYWRRFALRPIAFDIPGV